MPDDAMTQRQPAEGSLDGERPEPGQPQQNVLLGPLATAEDHARIAGAAMDIWEDGDHYWQRDIEQWRLNKARRMGYTNGQLRYNDVDDHWTAWFPKNASPDMSRDANKAAQLCRRFTSVMFADPPAPEVEPPSGEDKDADGAETSKRVLLDIQSPAQLNTPRKARMAWDRANDHGSGFVYYYVDEHGGGKAPLEVEARADAQHIDQALVNPVTGLEEGPYVKRYVRPDGTLTDVEGEAQTRWLPKLCSEVVTGRNVRPIPHTASDISEAHGAQLLVFRPWRDVVRRFPQLAQLPAEQRAALFQYKPEHADRIASKREIAAFSDSTREDERLVCVLTTYMEEQSDYEDGLYLVTLGTTFVAYRGKWIEEAEDGTKRKALVPLAQFAQFEEGRDSFFKVALMELVGGANEVRAAQIAYLLDHLDKLNNRKIFLPTNSVLTPGMLQYSRGTVLPMNPGGKPEFEDFPNYPRESLEVHDRMGMEMDNASGLAETAQGLEDSGVKSGRHALAIMGQVQAGLSEPRENIAAGYIRCCQIELQMIRRFYRQPRRLRWTGEDGSYKEKRWSGSDLLGETDIRLKPGSLSMMTPAAKSQLVEHYMSLALIPPDEARALVTENLGPVIGLQDDPFRMRIRRQLAAFEDGPPEGWMQQRQQLAQQVAAQATQQQQAAYPAIAGAAAAAGVVPPPAPPPVPVQPVPTVQPDPLTGQLVITDPTLAAIFQPVACDDLPGVAQVRLNEMAKFMSSVRYERLPADWRAGLEAEYRRAMVAAQAAVQPQQQPDPGEGKSEPGVPEGERQAIDQAAGIAA